MYFVCSKVSKQYIGSRPTLLCMQGDDDGRLVPKIQKFDYVRSTVIERKYVIVPHKTTLYLLRSDQVIYYYESRGEYIHFALLI